MGSRRIVGRHVVGMLTAGWLAACGARGGDSGQGHEGSNLGSDGGVGGSDEGVDGGNALPLEDGATDVAELADDVIPVIGVDTGVACAPTEASGGSDASDGDDGRALDDGGALADVLAETGAVAPLQACRRSPQIAGVCVPRSAGGWVGPGPLLTGAAPDLVAACPPTAPTEFAAGSVLGAQPSSCQGCTCASPEGLACGEPHVGGLYWEATCSEPCGPGMGNGTCFPRGSNCSLHGSNANYRSITPGVLSAGACAPSAPPRAPGIVYAQAARACVATIGDGPPPVCSAGRACIAAGFHTCIFHEGAALACPGAVYSERLVFNSRFDDSRACTSCTCGGPTGVSCPTRIEVRDASPFACTSEITDTFETQTQCLDLKPWQRPSNGSLQVAAGEPKGPGSCAPSGTATGVLSPADPFIACCIPE